MEPVRVGELHPLQNPSILKQIFKKLELDDLKSCRLVCKEWCQGSGDAMRHVGSEVRIRDEDGKRISDFLELVRVEGEENVFSVPPFMKDFSIFSVEGDSQTFWESCGAHIRSLALFHFTFQDADTFRHTVFQMCPNLEELKISCVKVCGQQASEPKEWVPPRYLPNRNLKSLTFYSGNREFSIGWLEMLSQFPRLQKLCVGDLWEKFEDFFGALEVARKHDPNFWKITEVELLNTLLPNISVPLAFERVFGGGDLVLTSLIISGIIGNTRHDVAAVRKLLIAHAPTLKTLHLSLASHEYPETDIFPLPDNQVFEKVEDLELSGFKWRSTRFLQAFPNVKQLTLEVYEILEDIQSPHVALNECTQLELHNHLDEDDFDRLRRLLPNLKRLRMDHVDRERFSMICEGWPELTHFQLFSGRWTYGLGLNDVALTGYDKKDVRKINRKGPKGSWRPITVRRPNLSSLKKLESFRWRLGSEEYSKLGYCSVACGILELPNLKYLSVELYDEEGLPLPLLHSVADKFTWNRAQVKIFD